MDTQDTFDILVVDDDGRSRELLRIVLHIEGFGVRTASGGGEALRAISTAPPDAVLLDLVMPDMDGLELCRRIRALALPHRLPLIVVSGMDDRSARQAAVAAGADDFIVKPFDRRDLRERLARLLPTRPAGRG